jgi:ADP-heptose:LPS heptosyltransferase
MATVLPRHLRKKFPDAKIDMTVREDFRELIEWNPYIDEKIYIPRDQSIDTLIKIALDIKKRNYDLIVDAHRSIRSRVVCLFNPFVKKALFNKYSLKRFILINLKFNLLKKHKKQMLEYLEPLKKYGLLYDDKGTEIFVPKDIKDNVALKVSKIIGDINNKKLIALVPSAHWPGKRWSSNKFKDLCGLILDSFKDVNIVVLGGSKDTFCKDIVSSYNRAYSFAGILSIIESAALLSMCELSICNDTGMMHVSEAVGIDTIGIMGPTSKEFGCYPYRSGSKVVELDMWCRPCSKNGSGFCIRSGKRPCLNMISTDMVFSKVLEILNKR